MSALAQVTLICLGEPQGGELRPMLMTVRVLLLTLTLWVLVGCSSETDGSVASDAPEVVAGSDPALHREASAQGAAVRVVGEAEADFILYVSNQSFDDKEVRLTVAVDGVTVVDDDFHVEGQHNWVQFPLALPPGAHEVTAESDTEATLRESFKTPKGETRYAVIDHWTKRNGSGDLTWRFQRQVMAFD